jgi:hypothetical protein
VGLLEPGGEDAEGARVIECEQYGTQGRLCMYRVEDELVGTSFWNFGLEMIPWTFGLQRL